MSSGLYVYAVVHNEIAAPEIAGALGTEALTVVPWRGLAAVTRRTNVESTTRTLDAIRHHEAVVESLLESRAALPVRFGTIFRDPTSLTSALAEQYDSLTADLHRLAGKVELGLTALWVHPSADDAPTLQPDSVPTTQHAGALYLRARAAHLQREETTRERARAIADTLDQRLSTLSLERRVQLAPTPRIALRATYLVERSGVVEFRTTFEEMRGAQKELRLLLTGPWPPYSFVTRTTIAHDSEPSSHLGELTRILEKECGSTVAEWPRR